MLQILMYFFIISITTIGLESPTVFVIISDNKFDFII
jgi:hypothetical protein